VVWRCDDSDDGAIEASSPLESGVGQPTFEEQLAMLRSKESEKVTQRLEELEAALKSEKVHDNEPAGAANGLDREEFMRDGVSYAFTTPASIEEWKGLYPFGITQHAGESETLCATKEDQGFLNDNKDTPTARDAIKSILVEKLVQKMLNKAE